MENKRRASREGSGNPRAKLTEDQVLEIRAIYAQKELTQAALGERFGVGQDSVSLIVNRKIWTHI